MTRATCPRPAYAKQAGIIKLIYTDSVDKTTDGFEKQEPATRFIPYAKMIGLMWQKIQKIPLFMVYISVIYRQLQRSVVYG